MSTSDLDTLVRQLALTQHGVFHLGQLSAVDPSRATRDRRVDRGAWTSLYDGVYRLGGVPTSWKGDLLAACYAGGPDAAGSRRSAMGVWDLPGGWERPAEITCKRWTRTREPAVVVHESLELEPEDVTRVDGIPVTTVARTLLDIGAAVNPLVVDMAIDAALRRELVTLPTLEAIVDRLGRPGRNGVGVLRKALAERDGRAPTESAMETWLLRVIRRHGLPAPIPQFVVRSPRGEFVARVDAAYPAAKLAIEYDSYQHHVGKAALVRDSARRNRLAKAGWTVLSVTAVDLQRGGDVLCRTIRECLLRASAYLDPQI